MNDCLGIDLSRFEATSNEISDTKGIIKLAPRVGIFYELLFGNINTNNVVIFLCEKLERSENLVVEIIIKCEQ